MANRCARRVGMRRAATTFLAVAVLLLGPGGASAGGAPAGVRQRLHAASVNVGAGCSGVLAEGHDLVVTARHCVGGHTSLALRFTNGLVRTGWVAGTDESADQAILLLEDPVPLEPLALARQRPVAGSILYFEGNPRKPRFQEARLERTGRCPSLPSLPNALFTTISGVPGDSGAPLVDAGGRVVGLVHGGAKCRIATPADALARLIDRVLGPGELRITRAARPAIAPPPRGGAGV